MLFTLKLQIPSFTEIKNKDCVRLEMVRYKATENIFLDTHLGTDKSTEHEIVMISSVKIAANGPHHSCLLMHCFFISEVKKPAVLPSMMSWRNCVVL